MRKALYASAIALSAALLFFIEPAAAKALLPRFGGSAGVWIACVLFFQATLLAGYAYAFALTRYLQPRAQRVIHAMLVVVSCFLLPWHPPIAQPGGHPAVAIVAALAVAIGLPFFTLSATSPLLQRWYAELPGARFPYRLFALSNAASMAVLLSYPALFEPALTLTAQFKLWASVYLAFALLVFMQAFGAPGLVRDDGAASEGDEMRVGYIIALTAIAAAMWPAVATHLSQEVAPIPFLWVLPLSLYLLSFVLCFEASGWYNTRLFRWLLPAACVVFGWRLSRQGSAGGIVWEIPIFSAALFVCCMFCHGEVARLKPEPKRGLALFYLMVAAGGALGAVFVSLVAPNAFKTYLELPIAIAACVIVSLPLLYRRGSARQLLRLALVGALAFLFASRFATGREDVARFRNFYGTLQVTDTGSADDAYRSLYNGKILHGVQYLSPERSRSPVAYYGVHSGIARAMEAVHRGNRRVAIVGLGAGSLAAYGRAGDLFRFYDINPLVIDVARRYFRFLAESAAHIETIAIDGRLGLESEPPSSFNLIALDAFSGDSIPVHLLTREAFRLYFSRLAPGGIVAIHVTNRYLDIASVVRALAADLHKPCLVIHNAAEPGRQIYEADWAVLSDDQGLIRDLTPFASVPAPAHSTPIWTDNYSNLFGILR